MDDLGHDRPGVTPPPSPLPAEPRPVRRATIFPWLIAALAVSFAFGLVANPWFERNVRARLPIAMRETADSALRIRLDAQERGIAALDARIAAIETRTSSQPLIGAPVDAQAAERLTRLETRLDAVDQTQRDAENQMDKLSQWVNRTEAALDEATAGATRAQDALLLTSVRRILETGGRLGPLEAALRRAFGDSPAVEAVAALGRAPVTPRLLQQDLARLRPELVQSAGSGGWWQSVKAGLADVVVVRRADAPKTTAPERIDQALGLLASGDVAGAAAQVDALPPRGRALAAGWRASARRQMLAMRALGNLEAAALDRPAPVPPVAAAPAKPMPTSTTSL